MTAVVVVMVMMVFGLFSGSGVGGGGGGGFSDVGGIVLSRKFEKYIRKKQNQTIFQFLLR